MKRYVAQRLLQLIPILLGVTILSFGLIHVVAGDTVDIMETNRGTALSAETKAKLRAELNLDKPFVVQYGIWLKTVIGKHIACQCAAKRPPHFLCRGG